MTEARDKVEVKKTLTTERVADLFSWATAWRSADPDGGTDLSRLRAANRAEFEAWLAEHDRQVKAEALEEFAAQLRERYPEDVFKPLSDGDHKSVNDALSGRLERTHVTRDRVSADMMRRAAEQSDQLAADIRADN